jgi:tRNA(Ile)-lysidine synthase
MAALCAAGTSRPPRGDNLDFLLRRLRDGEPFVTTLGGARIEVDWRDIRVMREAGEISRGGLAATPLEADRISVWDGRFEIVTDRPGSTVQALSGRASRLPDAEQRRLKTLPAAARPSLPVVIGPEGSVSCPILAEHPSVRVRALALARFEAALGRVDREPAP